MRRANALASSNLSSYNFNLDLIAQKPKTTNTESIKHKKEDKNLSSAKKRYLAKLMDERFNEFNSGDWIMYFQDAYKEATGENYIVGFYPKAHAIFKRLIKEFTVLEIRNMIDFIFKSNQDIEIGKSTRLNSSHANISYAVFCLKKKTHKSRATNETEQK